MPRGESAPDAPPALSERQYRDWRRLRRHVLQNGEGRMNDQPRWYAGVDWGSQEHCVFLGDAVCRKVGERRFRHGGEGLAELAAWLMTASGAVEPGQILVAIEVPHGRR
jgi:hypothetical protein